MTDVQIQTHGTVKFAYTVWAMDGASIEPRPGTWSLPPLAVRETFQHAAKEVVGLFACPHCNTACLFTRDQIEVDGVNHTAVLKLFRCANCPLVCKAVFEEWDRRKLYCVAYETRSPNGVIVANKEYNHAVDQQDAQHQFIEGHRGDPIVRVVGVALAIGFFVNDTKGDKLSV